MKSVMSTAHMGGMRNVHKLSVIKYHGENATWKTYTERGIILK
jgi:hypothetical protein